MHPSPAMRKPSSSAPSGVRSGLLDPIPRRLPVGAEVVPEGVHFRVWAPRRRQVEVVFEEAGGERSLEMALAAEAEGWFSELVEGAGDGGEAFPDPASRFQPAGPHGPSQVVDPAVFSSPPAISTAHPTTCGVSWTAPIRRVAAAVLRPVLRTRREGKDDDEQTEE